MFERSAKISAACEAMQPPGASRENGLAAGQVVGPGFAVPVDEGERVAVLSDVLGDEDHLGDMDFKVCGSRNGVTAVQMDIKIQGLI